MANERGGPVGLILVAGFGVLAMAFVLVVALIVLKLASLAGGQTEGPGEKVGVVEVTGLILDARDALEQLKAFRKDERVKAIVVRIDSPGGAVGPSQEIYREIRRTLETKPVVASMGATAASGGYYVAAAARKVVASGGTLTGSIGVITRLTHLEGLLKLVHVETSTVQTGPYKDVGSPFRPMTDEDRRLFDALLDDVYQQFVADVAQGRGLATDAVLPHADGRPLTGRQAQAAGLVDELGNFEDAVRLAAREAGVEGEPEVVHPPREWKGLLRELAEGGARSVVRGVTESLRDFQGLGTVLFYHGPAVLGLE
jgi:protease-4